jgi:putative tricarboxylic transport membrane protein
MAPLVLGLVMGPIFEKALRETLFLSGGDFSIFLERPISAVLAGLCVVALLAPSALAWVSRRRASRPALTAPVGNEINA